MRQNFAPGAQIFILSIKSQSVALALSHCCKWNYWEMVYNFPICPHSVWNLFMCTFCFYFYFYFNIPLWASETAIIITVKKLQLTGWKPGALKAAVQTGTQRRWTAWIALKYQHCCLNTATKTIPSTKRWGPTWEAFAVGTWRSPG